jgi:hypothetical protein
LATFTEIIMALPGETYESFAAGLETLLDCGQHSGINIYNCSILPNSEMALPEYQKEHGIRTVEIPVFQPHSSPPKTGTQVIEREHIAIATDSLPLGDWRRVQRFAWAVQCFHLLGLLQTVALALGHAFGVGYRDFYESLIARGLAGPDSLLGRELAHLDAVLDNVLAGKGFDQYLDGFGDLTWPPEEASFLRLAEGRNAFFEEAHAWARDLLESRGVAAEDGLLEDLFAYQRAVIKHYAPAADYEISLTWPWPDYVAACRLGKPGPLVRQAARYRVRVAPLLAGDRERFAREVVWFGRKGGCYLYDVERLQS